VGIERERRNDPIGLFRGCHPSYGSDVVSWARHCSRTCRQIRAGTWSAVPGPAANPGAWRFEGQFVLRTRTR
jgi:hypothetical protein